MSGTLGADLGERRKRAQARLALSRAALRQALLPVPDPTVPGGSGLADPLRRWWRRLRRAAGRSPVAALLTDAVQGWWLRHPLRPAGSLLIAELRPIVKRHPVATVAVAGLAGAALVGLRPWRWQGVGARLRTWPGRVTRSLLGELTSASMQAALAAWALMALQRESGAAGGAANDGSTAVAAAAESADGTLGR